MPRTIDSKSLSTQKAGVDRRGLEKPEECKTTTVKTLADYALQLYELNIRSLEAIAWPVAIIALVVLLRRSLQEMIPRLRHVEVGPLKLIIAGAYAESQELIETTETPQTVTTKEDSEPPVDDPADPPVDDATKPEIKTSPTTGSFRSAQTNRGTLEGLLDSAEITPTMAIAHQWGRIEISLWDIAGLPMYKQNAPKPAKISGRPRTPSTGQIVSELRSLGLINQDLSEIIDSLSLVSSKAIHLSPHELNFSRDDAKKYIASGEVVLHRLRKVKRLLAPRGV